MHYDSANSTFINDNEVRYWRSLAGNGGVWHTPNPCFEKGRVVSLYCYSEHRMNEFFDILKFIKTAIRNREEKGS